MRAGLGGIVEGHNNTVLFKVLPPMKSTIM